VLDLSFREVLVQLGNEDFFNAHYGNPNPLLMELWSLSIQQARIEGVPMRSLIAAWQEGYDTYMPSEAPWARISFEAISGISDPEGLSALEMAEISGRTMAAYGVRITPKPYTDNS